MKIAIALLAEIAQKYQSNLLSISLYERDLRRNKAVGWHDNCRANVLLRKEIENLKRHNEQIREKLSWVSDNIEF